MELFPASIRLRGPGVLPAILLSLIIGAAPLVAEEPGGTRESPSRVEPGDTPDGERGADAKEGSRTVESSERRSDQNTVLPAPEARPLGFHSNRISLSTLAGPAVSAPSGSLIGNEKSYDSILLYQIQNGQITSFPLGEQARFFNPTYESGPMGLWDLEAAMNNHFGAGATLLFSSVSTTRLDVLPWTDASGNRYLNYPDKRVLYSEGALLGFLSYHPFSQTRFDPYVKLRAGITFAHGYAHQYSFPDPYVFESDMNNARGAIYGASVGLNVYITPYSALTLEYTSLGRSISADQFGNRTLDTGYLTVGVTLGMFQ